MSLGLVEQGKDQDSEQHPGDSPEDELHARTSHAADDTTRRLLTTPDPPSPAAAARKAAAPGGRSPPSAAGPSGFAASLEGGDGAVRGAGPPNRRNKRSPT